MPNGLVYKMMFRNANFENKLCTVKIIDTLSNQATPVSYNITVVLLSYSFDFYNYQFTYNIPVGAEAVRARYIYYYNNQTYDITTAEYAPTSPIVIGMAAQSPIVQMWFHIRIAGVWIEIDLTNPNPLVIPLEAAGDPFDIAVVDNDEDKYKVVRGKQATIRFNSTSTINLSSFAVNSFDQRWYVEADIEGRFIFKGFLILDDSNEPFLSPSNEVVLIAADGLGRIKNAALVNFDNTNPRGYFTIAQFIAMALRKTGLSLSINVAMNIKEESSAPLTSNAIFVSGVNYIEVPTINQFWKVGKKIKISNSTLNNGVVTIAAFGVSTTPYQVYVNNPLVSETAANVLFEDVDGHLYNRIVLNAKTFEAEINVSVDSYRALEMMLSENCFITQEKGQWWIYRIDELARAATAKVTVFDENGMWLHDNVNTAYNKLVKIDTPIWFSNKQTRVSLSQALKHIKHTYRYDYPREIICNIDFVRGAGAAANPTVANETIEYVPECMGLFANTFNGTSWVDGAVQAGARGVLIKRYEFGYEKERYLLVEHEDVAGDDLVHYLKLESFEVKEFDKIDFSVDFKLSVNGFTSLNPVQITLVPDNGTAPWYWELDTASNVNQWVQRATITTSPFSKTLRWQGTVSNEWQTVGDSSRPMPATGKLYIRLCTNVNVFAPYHFSNLRVEYSAFINGSYKKYSGHSFKVTQQANAEKYIPTREKEVSIGDKPSKNFKGAMFVAGGIDYNLAGRFYDASLYPSGPAANQLFQYGEIIAFDVFNQFNREFRTFRAALQGLTSDAVDDQGRADLPGLTHKYQLGDMSQHTTNKRFQLLAFEQNIKLCGWRGVVLKEVYDSGVAKVMTGVEFKYLE